MATHSNILAWTIPWTEEPGKLQSIGSQRIRHDWATNTFTFFFHFHALEKEMTTHSSVLAWRIPGTGEPGGLPSLGSHRVGHDWSDLAAAAALHKRSILWSGSSENTGWNRIKLLGWLVFTGSLKHSVNPKFLKEDSKICRISQTYLTVNSFIPRTSFSWGVM